MVNMKNLRERHLEYERMINQIVHDGYGVCAVKDIASLLQIQTAHQENKRARAENVINSIKKIVDSDEKSKDKIEGIKVFLEGYENDKLDSI